MGRSSVKPCACENVKRCRAGEVGRLFLWFPVPHTLTKVTAALKQSCLGFELMQERPGLGIDCKFEQAQEVARHLAKLVTPGELKETQVLFIRGAVQPQLEDFSDMASLQRFVTLSQSGWLMDMLAHNRFTSHFQPIVSIQDTSQIYGYESLL